MKKIKSFRNLNIKIRKEQYNKIINDPANKDSIPIVIELHPLSQIQTN